MKNILKILKDSDILEKVLAGIFGGVAVVAIFFEMIIAGFDSAAIAGGIKDFAGVVVDVAMLLVAVTIFKTNKKPIGDFDTQFNEEMDKIILKYEPLITKDEEKNGRYKIADTIDVLSKNITSPYSKFFDFDIQKGLSFSVSKTLFMGRSKEDFSKQQALIINSITSKITNEHPIINKNYKPIPDGFNFTFTKKLSTSDDAIEVAEVIDHVILLYIVENKKS